MVTVLGHSDLGMCVSDGAQRLHYGVAWRAGLSCPLRSWVPALTLQMERLRVLP